MSNEDGSVWVVFNGEIYNYRDLRKRLEGKDHRFRTDSDTETIVHLYEDLGTECFAHLNGMFAIAIWDRNKRQLILARDRLGKKPLFYQWLDNQLLFGSELKALAQSPSFDKQISAGAIDQFLTYQYVPHPNCIYQNARKLPPGSFAVVRDASVQVGRYWKVDWRDEVAISEQEASAKLEELLRDSIRLRTEKRRSTGCVSLRRCRLVTDRCTCMSRIGHPTINSQQLDRPLLTFSIGFEESDFDETHYAGKSQLGLGQSIRNSR